MTCLRLILGEMQAAQLLHPHVGVPQLCHVVAQGQDAVVDDEEGLRHPKAFPPPAPSPHRPACEPAGGSRCFFRLHPKARPGEPT